LKAADPYLLTIDNLLLAMPAKKCYFPATFTRGSALTAKWFLKSDP
jgi:hypothetical protein